MIFRRRFLLLPLTALVVALLWAGSAQIYRDWRAGYSTRRCFCIQPVNWPLYNAKIYARKFGVQLQIQGEIEASEVRFICRAKRGSLHERCARLHEAIPPSFFAN